MASKNWEVAPPLAVILACITLGQAPLGQVSERELHPRPVIRPIHSALWFVSQGRLSLSRVGEGLDAMLSLLIEDASGESAWSCHCIFHVPGQGSFFFSGGFSNPVQSRLLPRLTSPLNPGKAGRRA